MPIEKRSTGFILVLAETPTIALSSFYVPSSIYATAERLGC